jgi:glycerophosphoryl diester phosphodiesterase
VSGERRTQVIAHRGASRERAENTLPAFLRALELGADGIELDVHATRDHVVVVHHDAIPRAKAPSPSLIGRPIADLTMAELRDFRVSGDNAIPTLEEVLLAVGDRAEVFIEIKGRNIERQVVACVGDHGARCAIHCFDHRVVKRVRKLAPEMRTGILLASYLVESDAAMTSAGALDLWQQWEFIDEQLVADVHSIGGRVIAWTVNDPTKADELVRSRVDAICSDLPGSILGSHRRTT